MADSSRPGTTITATGNAEIDGILSLYKWSPDSSGGLTNVTYGFPTQGSQYTDLPTSRTEPNDNFQGFTTFQQQYLKPFLDATSTFSNLILTELTGDTAGDAAIRFGWTTPAAGSESAGAGGWADQPASNPGGGDVWMNSAGVANGPTTQNIPADLFITVHELGHALGLEHPHERVELKTTLLPTNLDGPEYTYQSYNMSAQYKDAIAFDLAPQTWMWLDIQALQTLYGKNTTATAGNETYTYDGAKRHFLTIWDAGGKDTFSIKNTTANLILSLVPGTWSDVGTTVTYTTPSGNKTMQKTVYIAPDTTIENATGADGNDSITGNDANNSLIGNAGHDTISGGKGNDFIAGGQGDDSIIGGEGNDSIFAGKGDTGNDTVTGGTGDDVIGVGVGNDSVDAGAGNDKVFGSDGNDSIIGGDGNDTLWGGKGNDTVSGGDGDDVIGLSSGNDSVDAGAGNDKIYASDGNDTIVGGAGNDTVWSGKGDDVLTGGDGADTFGFAQGHGNDKIADFNIGEDTLILQETATNFTNASTVRTASTATSVSGESGVLIDTGGGDSLFLVGVSLNDVDTIQFAF